MSRNYLALLRGINVGGKNKVLMKDLAEIFRSAGATNVQTFIQSGNVIFDTQEDAYSIKGRVESALRLHLGKAIPLVIRTKEEMGLVLSRNPFPLAVESSLGVMFLADAPSNEALANLDPARSAPDEFVVVGREIYLNIQTSFAVSKLTNQYFDTRLKTVSTTRNWRTVIQLTKLMGDLEDAVE